MRGIFNFFNTLLQVIFIRSQDKDVIRQKKNKRHIKNRDKHTNLVNTAKTESDLDRIRRKASE